MDSYEILKNGVEVVYAFGSVPDMKNKRFVFLAGTTPWNGELLTESWRRYFLDKIGLEKNIEPGTVFCIPEPQHGKFAKTPTRHLIDWEAEYLDRSNLHVYWLNTYWSIEQAIHGASPELSKYFSDGSQANIGVTVRCELGASFSRYRHSNNGFELIIGAPQDAQGLAWVSVHSKLFGVPIYWLYKKNSIFSSDWYRAILHEIS